MTKRISVAMCTYNGEKYVREQILSIISQTRKPDEVIICDDCSTDNTLEIINEIVNGSLVEIEWIVIRNSNNLGVLQNFEKAIGLSTGDLIFTSDQDDIWVDNKIEIIENTFLNNQSCMLAFTNAELVDCELTSLGGNLWNSVGLNLNSIGDNKKDGSLLDVLLRNNVVTGATMAFTSDLKDFIYPFSEKSIHDEWIAIIAASLGNVIPIDQKLILYRQHDNNVIGASTLSLKEKANKYLNNFFKMKEIRKALYYKYADVSNRLSLIDKDNNHDCLKGCISFWKRKMELNDKSIIKGTAIIIIDLINGDYNRYYTGFRGAFRDFICLFL